MLGMITFIPALQLTSVSNVAIIIATGPFVAAAIAWIWLRETLSAAPGPIRWRYRQKINALVYQSIID